VPVEEIELRIIRDQWGTPLGPLTEDELCYPFAIEYALREVLRNQFEGVLKMAGTVFSDRLYGTKTLLSWSP
jgi:hypothetical protein